MTQPYEPTSRPGESHRAPGAPDPVRPHEVLDHYYPETSAHRAFVDRIFDDTSADYDRIEWWLGFGSGAWYRGQALRRAGLREAMAVLDVGVGTGLVAREAAAIVGDARLVTGVDPSAGMMAHARVPEGVRLVRGSGETLPFPERSFDFVTMGFALRHLSSLRAAAQQFHRVLRPGGRVCILEITRPEGTLSTLALKAYMRGVVPALAALVARGKRTPAMWRYYWDTIEACVPPAAVMDTLRDAGFASVRRHVELGIFSEYTAQRPA